MTVIQAIAAVALALSAVWVAVRAVRWAKKGTKGGALLVAAAFPDPERPPPQQLVEEELRLKKEADSGDPPK